MLKSIPALLNDDTYQIEDACSGLRLLIFANEGTTIPGGLLEGITAVDPNAQIKRQWSSVIAELEENCFDAHDVIVDVCDHVRLAAVRIDEIWSLRVKANYAMRPAYLVIAHNSHPMARFETERRGGRFLLLADTDTGFGEEVEQIKIEFASLSRSLPQWCVVRQGVGLTARAAVFLRGRRMTRVRGGDVCSAVLAVLLKNNGIPRSICEITKLLSEDPLFEPAGGSFALPSCASLKMYLHRAFPKYLQEAFDQDRSGYSAEWVIEREKLDEKTVGYRIRGKCLLTAYFE